LLIRCIVVSRAFQVLSDADKKAKYDRFGGDPDSRFPGASAGNGPSGFSGFGRPQGGQRGGAMFEEEISPEEMFRQFFGGGMGGGFGGGGPFGTQHESFLRLKMMQMMAGMQAERQAVQERMERQRRQMG
jgi:DnaJ-class molecular chaperone